LVLLLKDSFLLRVQKMDVDMSLSEGPKSGDVDMSLSKGPKSGDVDMLDAQAIASQLSPDSHSKGERVSELGKRKAETDLPASTSSKKHQSSFFGFFSWLYWNRSSLPESSPSCTPQATQPVTSVAAVTAESSPSCTLQSTGKAPNSIWTGRLWTSWTKATPSTLEPMPVVEKKSFTAQHLERSQQMVDMCTAAVDLENTRRDFQETAHEMPWLYRLFMYLHSCFSFLLYSILGGVQGTCTWLLGISIKAEKSTIQWIQSRAATASQDSTSNGQWWKPLQDLENIQDRISVRKMCLLYTVICLCLWVVFEYLMNNMYCIGLTTKLVVDPTAKKLTHIPEKILSKIAMFLPDVIWRARLSLASINGSMWILYNGSKGRRNFWLAFLICWTAIFPLWELVCLFFRQRTDCAALRDNVVLDTTLTV